MTSWQHCHSELGFEHLGYDSFEGYFDTLLGKFKYKLQVCFQICDLTRENWVFFISKYHTQAMQSRYRAIPKQEAEMRLKYEITSWQRRENFPGLVPWFISKKTEAQGSEMTCLK